MKNIVFLISVCVLLGFSCKKKNKASEESNSSGTTTGILLPSPPNYVIPVPADADGALFASRAPYIFPSFTTLLGKASAFFYTAPGNYNYVDAGIVKCNDSVLVKQSGGSYYFGGKAINYQTYSGIDFTSSITWSVSGNVAPAFTYSTNVFPTDGVLTSPLIMYKNANYNLTLSGASAADSIVIYLTCDSIPVKKTIPGNATSTTIFASQIAASKKSGTNTKGFLNLIPYTIQSKTVSAKKYYLVNSTTATFTVSIQ